MAKNIGTLAKYDQRRLWKLICIVNPFDLLIKKRYRHVSSSRQFRIILCLLEIINYCPDGGNVNFTAPALFLKPLHYFVKLNYLLLHIRNIFFVFSHCDGWLRELIWALFSLLFIFLWNKKPWLDNFMFIITLECSQWRIWMGIYFRQILLIRISRGANNCVQHVFEKNIYFIIFPPF